MSDSNWTLLSFIAVMAIIFIPLTMWGNSIRDKEEKHLQVRRNECKDKGGTFFVSENICVDATRIRLSDDQPSDNR